MTWFAAAVFHGSKVQVSNSDVSKTHTLSALLLALPELPAAASPPGAAIPPEPLAPPA
jgi:hypothetical protein